MKKTLFLFLVMCAMVQASTLRIATAANMSYAMEALKVRFEKAHPDTQLEIMVGSSGKLAAQISNGAPIDLFLSANMKYPQALYEEGLTQKAPVVYAKGVLVMLSTKPRDYTRGLKLLESPQIKKIAVANPKTAPYGVAAEEALKHAGVYDAVKEKFVYGESVSQTVTYAVRAADIGLIAKSALFSPHMKMFKKGTNWADVDAKLYTPIAQGMVLVKKSRHQEEAQQFYDFLLGDEGRHILLAYGYLLP